MVICHSNQFHRQSRRTIVQCRQATATQTMETCLQINGKQEYVSKPLFLQHISIISIDFNANEFLFCGQLGWQSQSKWILLSADAITLSSTAAASKFATATNVIKSWTTDSCIQSQFISIWQHGKVSKIPLVTYKRRN